MVQMHSLSNTLISSASSVPIPSPLRSSLGALDLPELDRSGSDALSGGGDLQTPTTGRVTDITGMGSPRPSFSTFGGVGLASPFVGGDVKEGAEKQRRFEGENKYADCTASKCCPFLDRHLLLTAAFTLCTFAWTRSTFV